MESVVWNGYQTWLKNKQQQNPEKPRIPDFASVGWKALKKTPPKVTTPPQKNRLTQNVYAYIQKERTKKKEKKKFQRSLGT